jgi:hypothetical protein
MRIYANADSTIMTAVRSVEIGAPAARPPLSVSLAAETLDFDDETNTGTATAIETEPGRFRLSGGVLTRDGASVTINPPGRFIQDREQIEQALGQLVTFLESLDAGQNLTAAQVQQAIKFLLRVARYVLRWIVRRG